jgi:phosphoserine phosphatase
MKEIIDPKQINSVIFDFDGTLCFGRYFETLGSDSLEAIGALVFNDHSARWADPWMKGVLTSHDIASYLSSHLLESEDEILFALRKGCSNMDFNPAVHTFALQQRESGRKTALVTANMDVFTEVVVPSHGLDSTFDLVLNTADHQTLDKSILWRKAFGAFGSGFSFATSVLIDDSPRMVSLFRSLGGYAYQYEGDEAFQTWLDEIGFI